jgi:hypothetical protein
VWLSCHSQRSAFVNLAAVVLVGLGVALIAPDVLIKPGQSVSRAILNLYLSYSTNWLSTAGVVNLLSWDLWQLAFRAVLAMSSKVAVLQTQWGIWTMLFSVLPVVHGRACLFSFLSACVLLILPPSPGLLKYLLTGLICSHSCFSSRNSPQ